MQLQSATYSQEWDAWIENIFEVNEDVFGQESSFPDNPFCWFIFLRAKMSDKIFKILERYQRIRKLIFRTNEPNLHDIF